MEWCRSSRGRKGRRVCWWMIPLVLLAGGCSSGSSGLYYWGEYPEATYAYLRGDRATPAEQVAALEKTLREAKRKEERIPPGLHAQLGLLYARLGDLDRAREHWRREKALYPSSETFMDFVLEESAL